MIAAALSALGLSKLWGYVAEAGIILAVIGAIWFWHAGQINAHDKALRDKWVADAKLAEAQARADAYAAGQKVSDQRHAAELAAVQASAPVIQRIYERAKADPNVVSAPDLAAIDELRRRAASAGRGP